MHWILEITDENQPAQVMELAPGEYRIGRATVSEVHLDDRSVSKLHATLHVSTDGVLTVRDEKSANGTRVDGKPVIEKRLAGRAEIQIAGFRLMLSPPDIVLGKPKKGFLPDARMIFIAVMVLFLSVVILTSHLQMKGTLKAFREKGSLSHGATLVTWLGEMNRYFLSGKHHDQLTLDPVASETGVLQAFIVGSTGRILKPLEYFGNYLEMADLDAILTSGTLTIRSQGPDETLMIYPIIGPSYPYGAAVIRFRTSDWGRDLPAPGSGQLMLFLISGGLISLVTGLWLYRQLLSPVRLLTADLDRALTENDTRLQTPPPTDDHLPLWEAVSRLLVRVAYQKKTESAIPAGSHRPAAPPLSAPECRLSTHPYPACRVATDSYLIKAWNPAFKERFSSEKELTADTHLIEVIQHPELVNMAFDLLQSENPKPAIAGTCKLSLYPSADDSGTSVVLSFQEIEDANR
ncbi:MAG: hypothetical protein CSA22_02570 [Deltaproteobacteria bacterium]|nr:MAG: hypothetical protein CSA22_02570 [Deltaproteobacteria bacterium]